MLFDSPPILAANDALLLAGIVDGVLLVVGAGSADRYEVRRAKDQLALIGTPDPVWVQCVKAIVVLKPDETATDADIIEHCRARIASYKKPRQVVFVEAGGGAGEYFAARSFCATAGKGDEQWRRRTTEPASG